MTKAVDAGLPKLRIEESAARRQSRIDRGEEVVVGVNRYQSEVKDEVDILDIDNTAVREAQVARLKNGADNRNEAACMAALEALSAGADDPTANLLELSVNAARTPCDRRRNLGCAGT